MNNDSNNKIMAILCYIGILWIVPLLTDSKDNAFVKFHINQGIVLTIVGVIIGVFTAIPFIGWVLGPILGIVLLVLHIIGIINAVNMQEKPVPIVGKFQIYK